jgi:hypothetical protein
MDLFSLFRCEDLALEVCPDILDTSCILQKSYKKFVSITTDVLLVITALFLILDQYNRVGTIWDCAVHVTSHGE